MLPVALSQKAPTVETVCPPLFLPVRILEKSPVPQFADSRLELVPQMSVPAFPPPWALQGLAGEFLSGVSAGVSGGVEGSGVSDGVTVGVTGSGVSDGAGGVTVISGVSDGVGVGNCVIRSFRWCRSDQLCFRYRGDSWCRGKLNC